MSGLRKSIGVLCAVALAIAVSVPALAASSDSREDYVATLDPICKRDAKRNSKLLDGTEAMVIKGKFAAPARKWAKASKNFKRTLKRLEAIPSPPADAALLKRWFRQMNAQQKLMEQMTKALKAKDTKRANKLKIKLLRNSNKANNTVFLFDFRQCLIVPEMYL